MAQGINFADSLSFSELLQKAKLDKKYLFLDVYATWCGPCKYMDSQIYPNKEVGDFFNTYFVSAKMQIDQVKTDNEQVRNWYEDAKNISQKYKVTTLPAFLFFNQEGSLIYRFSGSSDDGSSFISKARKVLDKDEQYFFLLNEYNQGERNTSMINTLLELAKATGDEKMIMRIRSETGNPLKVN